MLLYDKNTQNRALEPAEVQVDENTITLSVASPEPYLREDKKIGPYYEVLEISEDAIDYERLVNERCPLLLQHDMDKQIGVVEYAYIGYGKLCCRVRFSESNYAQSVLKDIKAGIRRNVSIGYEVLETNIEYTNGSDYPIVHVVRWKPYEISSVSVPADPTVGYERAMKTKEDDQMDKEELEKQKKAEEAAAEDEKKTKAEEAEADKEEKEAQAEETPEKEEEKKKSKKACEEEAADKEEKAKKDCGEDEDDKDEIRSLGQLTGTEKLAEEFILQNRSYKEFKTALKERANNKEKSNLKDKKTMEKFSLLRALNMNTSKYKGNPEETFEYKVIEENKRALGITDADIVVTRANLRAIDGTESLNQTDYRPDMYTENLRPESVIAKTGCRVVDVSGPSISFSVATSGVNAGWVDLNNEIPSATMDWTLKTITPKKCGAFVEIDYKALLQDRPSVESIIVDDIVRGLDQAKDEAFICGDGTNNSPVGITATSGINEVPISSAFTLSGVFGFEKAIRDSNDYAEDLKWVMNSKNYYKYATTPYSATEQNKMLIDTDTRKMIGYDVVICNALTDNDIILGNFNELLVALFDGMRLKVVEDAGLSRKQAVEVQAFEAANCLVRRPKSFTISKA